MSMCCEPSLMIADCFFVWFICVGHYKFTNVNQLMKSAVSITLSTDLSFSLWVRRDVAGIQMFVFNIGVTGYVNQMLSAGYRVDNTFTYAL
jgi:hypothetical protein